MSQFKHRIFDDADVSLMTSTTVAMTRPLFSVTARDVRCAMVNIDPDTGHVSTSVLKAVVRDNDNNAGVYATVTRTEKLVVDQTLRLHR